MIPALLMVPFCEDNSWSQISFSILQTNIQLESSQFPNGSANICNVLFWSDNKQCSHFVGLYGIKSRSVIKRSYRVCAVSMTAVAARIWFWVRRSRKASGGSPNTLVFNSSTRTWAGNIACSCTLNLFPLMYWYAIHKQRQDRTIFQLSKSSKRKTKIKV